MGRQRIGYRGSSTRHRIGPGIQNCDYIIIFGLKVERLEWKHRCVPDVTAEAKQPLHVSKHRAPSTLRVCRFERSLLLNRGGLAGDNQVSSNTRSAISELVNDQIDKL